MYAPTPANVKRWLQFAGAFFLCTLTIYACGGGNSVAGGTLSAADFHKLLLADQSFTDLGTAEENDAAAIKNIGLIGHVPGATTARDTARSTMAVTQAVDTTDYGICTDMGQHVANSLPPNLTHDISGEPIDVFKQCTGTKYLVNTETGAIGTVPTIWFPSLNCAGTPIEFEADGVFDRPTLQGGITFKSPKDGSVRWVKPLGAGASTQQVTSHSVYSAGSCTNADETHVGYDAVSNVTDGSDGSGVPDSGVPNTYVYD